MNLRILGAFAVLMFAFFVSSVSAQTLGACTPFARNLSVGAVGADVKLLQQLLNKESATRVSLDGPGAPGQETSYFGLKTKAAVVKFQELYAKDVLTPVGLVKGTGFVGTFSRAKLTLLCVSLQLPAASASSPAQSVVNTTPASTATSPAEVEALPIISTEKLVLRSQSSYTVLPGGQLTIFGGGFTSGMMLHIGETFSFAVPNTSDSVMRTITLPPNTPKGKSDFWLSDLRGASNKSFIIVADAGVVAPKVTSFTPNSGKAGTVVTVMGEGFTQTNNEIYAGQEVIKGVPSADGKTLKFTMNLALPGMAMDPSTPKVEAIIPLWFYVVNANGMSNSSVFTLNY